MYDKAIIFHNNKTNRSDIQVSIVIPTKSRNGLLMNCLDSIREHTHGITYELVIVDGSNDWNVFNLVRNSAQVVYVKELVPRGVISAFNRGFENCEGVYTVWLNDDVLVEKDWLNIAYAAIEKDKEMGLGCIFHKEGAFASYGFGPKSANKMSISYIWDGDYCVRTLSPHTKHPNLPYANFGIIKTDLLRKLGYWNERDYRSYVSDTELAHVVWDFGLKVKPIWGSKIQHLFEQDELRRINGEVYAKERDFYDSKWRK